MPNELARTSTAGIARLAPGGPIVPAIIADAGEQAVEQYRAYFDKTFNSRATRNVYRSRIGKFLRWAEGRHLSLATISADNVEAFIRETGKTATAKQFRTSIRSLLRYFVTNAVLTANPLETPDSLTAAAHLNGDGPIIPAIIADAGEQAAEQYRAFFNPLKTATAEGYGAGARRFCRWAAKQGLSLTAIQTKDAERFENALRQDVAAKTAHIYMAGVRSLFRGLTSNGIIPANPFVGQSPPDASSFDLLALLAMLAEMEPESLRTIFDEESIARALLTQIRWPDGPACLTCFSDEIETAADHADGQDHRCLACGRHFDVLAGTMFEASPLALRHWLRLIHQYLSDAEPLSDSQLAERIGVDPSSLSSFRRRVQAVIDLQRVPSGDALKEALTEKNRQLANDLAARHMVRYGEMVEARNNLIRARAEGTAVLDLPVGVSLDEALAMLDERIAEEDKWVFYLEDGRILRKLAEATPTDEPRASSDEQ